MQNVASQNTHTHTHKTLQTNLRQDRRFRFFRNVSTSRRSSDIYRFPGTAAYLHISVRSIMNKWESSVGIAARYVLDGPGIESWWGRGLTHPSRPVTRPTHPPVLWDTGSFSGVKRPESGVDHPPPFSAEVKGRVELCFYCPSGPS